MKYLNKLIIVFAIVCISSFCIVCSNPIINLMQNGPRIERDEPKSLPYCDNRIYCVGEDCNLLKSLHNNKPCLVCACS